MKWILGRILVLCLGGFIQGCTTMYWEPTSKHRAVYVASVVCQHYPVRFVPGTLRNEKHIETQAKIEGEWKYVVLVELDFKPDIVEPRNEIPGFVPAGKTLTLEEYLSILGLSPVECGVPSQI